MLIEQVASIEELAQERAKLWEKAKHNLEKASRRYMKMANRHRREREFEVGDEVWLDTKHLTMPTILARKIASRFCGPFKVMQRIGAVSYRLKLSEELSAIHDVFHVSLLKPVIRDSEDPERSNAVQPVPVDTGAGDEYEVENIIDERTRKRGGQTWKEYLVLWKGYSPCEATWEPEENLAHAQNILRRFQRGKSIAI